MKTLIRAWDRFWFAPQPLLNAAVARILLCGTLFLMDFSRQFDLAKFYSEEGIVPVRWALGVIPDFYRPLFPWFFWSDAGMPWAHGALVAGLLLLTLGIGGRVLTLLVWILHIGFLQRNYAIAFGADLVGNTFLFLMIGMQTCARLSLWNRLRGSRGLQPGTGDWIHSAFYRLLQIQLCTIYCYTGWEKLKGGLWWDGTALWIVFANPQMVVADLSWTRYFPWVLVLLTFLTMLFEMYFPVLVWVKKTRPFVLLAGFFFHLGIGLTMALMNFAVVMLSPYVLFVDESELRRGLRRLGLRRGID